MKRQGNDPDFVVKIIKNNDFTLICHFYYILIRIPAIRNVENFSKKINLLSPDSKGDYGICIFIPIVHRYNSNIKIIKLLI